MSRKMAIGCFFSFLLVVAIAGSSALAEEQTLASNWRENPVAAGFKKILDRPLSYIWISDIKTQEFLYSNFSMNHPVAIRSIMYRPPNVVWDVVYNIDSYGRRKTVQAQRPRSEFIALLGCSYIFGTGVNDGDTIASQLAKHFDSKTIYNYGVRAAGPNQILRLAELKNLRHEISEHRGTFLYVYIADQLNRVWGLRAASSFASEGAWYDRDGADFHYAGTLNETHPFWMKFSRAFYAIFPNTYESMPDFDFLYPRVCDSIAAIRDRILRQFPDSKFAVTVHPLSYDARFESCMRERTILVIPQAKLAHESTDKHPNESHPSASFNRKWSLPLGEALNALDK